jgi:hypothetical protein
MKFIIDNLPSPAAGARPKLDTAGTVARARLLAEEL